MLCKWLLPTTLYFIHKTACCSLWKYFMPKICVRETTDILANLLCLLIEACKVWHAVFLDSPLAQFASKACEFQVSHTYQSNLLHTKLSLNRTWCRTSTGPRQPCNMTKEGKHHSDSCLFSKASVGVARSRGPPLFPWLTLAEVSICTEQQWTRRLGIFRSFSLSDLSWWQLLKRSCECGRRAELRCYMFAQWSCVLFQACTLSSFPGSSKHRWRNMQVEDIVVKYQTCWIVICSTWNWIRQFLFFCLTLPFSFSESVSSCCVCSGIRTVACCLSSHRSSLEAAANLALQLVCCFTQLVRKMITKEIN